MIEIPFYFRNRTYNLFGVLHEPVSNLRNTGFVCIYPFAEEKLWAQRVFVTFARELSNRGYPVLRFDFMGHGDSEGNFEDSTVDTRLSDIKCATDILKEKVPGIEKIVFLGLRFGATLASVAGEQISDVDKLILWEPIIDGSKYIKEILRINLATQTAVYGEIRHERDDLIKMMKEGKTVNCEGYELSYELYEQVSSINMIKKSEQYHNDCFIAQISRRKQNFKKDFEELKMLYPNAKLSLSVEEPFWKEIKRFYSVANNLFEDTLSYLERSNV